MRTRLGAEAFSQIQGRIAGMQAKSLEAGEQIVQRASDFVREIPVIDLKETSEMCGVLPCIGETTKTFLGRIGINYQSAGIGEALTGRAVKVIPGRDDSPR